MDNTAKAVEQRQEDRVQYTNQEIYDGLKKLTGDNFSTLLQSIILSNQADIDRAIQYWKNKKDSANEEGKIEIQHNIDRYENIMLTRLQITEDLFANSIPIMGIPSFNVPDIEKEEKKSKKEKGRVIDHPASKDRKKEKTVNDELGEKIAAEKEKRAAESKYDQVYPTDKEKEDAIRNKLIPSLQKYLTGYKKKNNDGEEVEVKPNLDNAKRSCKIHFKTGISFRRDSGKQLKPFCSDKDIERFVNWLKDDHFRARSYLSILRNEPLSIKDIVDEVERLVVEVGLGYEEVKNLLKPYILNVKLKEHDKKEDIISTMEEYDSFFQKSVGYLFDEDEARRRKADFEEKNKTKEDIKLQFYETHKEEGVKIVSKITRDLKEWLRTKGEESNLKALRNEVVNFLKSKDPELYAEYQKYLAAEKKSSGGNKDTSKEDEKREKEPEKSDKADGEKGETDPSSSKTESKRVEKKKNKFQPKYPKLEDQLIRLGTFSLLKEKLLNFVNKNIGTIGNIVPMDEKIEAITHLAKKRILEMGMEHKEKADDWTEQDVAQWIAQTIVPYIIDEYRILAAKDWLSLKRKLRIYLEKYPAGEEKERTKKIKEVLTSDVPREKFMKARARKVRKGDFSEINQCLKEIVEDDIKKQKEEKKKE